MVTLKVVVLEVPRKVVFESSLHHRMNVGRINWSKRMQIKSFSNGIIPTTN